VETLEPLSGEISEAVGLNGQLLANVFGGLSIYLDRPFTRIRTFTKTVNWVEYHQIKQDVLLKILAIVHANRADVAFPTRTLQMEQQVEQLSPEPGL